MIWNSIIQNPHQPQGPQNLAYNSMYSPGHGAFIPLQAVRQNSKVRPIYAQPVYIFFLIHLFVISYYTNFHSEFFYRL